MLNNLTTSFDALPDSAFVRASQLVKSSKRSNTIPLFPFSSATLWRRVTDGTFPKPVKLSSRVTAWRVGEVREFINELSGRAMPNE